MPRRKRSTFGCVQEMRKGVWRIRWPEDTPKGRKRRSETVYGSRRDTERRLAEIRLAVRENPSPTIGELWRDFVLPSYEDDLAAGRKKPRTVHTYVAAWKGVVGDRWANVPIASLKAVDVQDWLLTLAGGTARPALVNLRNVSAVAELRELVPVDPLRRPFRLPAAKGRDRKVPDLAGLSRLWGLCRGRWDEPVFLLCAHAGLRVGEACGLRPTDIEWRHGEAGLVAVLGIERQVSTLQEIDTPKFGSARVAVMTDPWASRLGEIIDGLREDAVYIMDDGASDPEKLPNRRRIAERWEEICRGTEFEGMPLQRMRPAYETYMHWELGVPLEKVAKLMGHKSTLTTQLHYDRPEVDSLVAVATAASATMATVFRNT